MKKGLWNKEQNSVISRTEKEPIRGEPSDPSIRQYQSPLKLPSPSTIISGSQVPSPSNVIAELHNPKPIVINDNQQRVPNLINYQSSNSISSKQGSEPSTHKTQPILDLVTSTCDHSQVKQSPQQCPKPTSLSYSPIIQSLDCEIQSTNQKTVHFFITYAAEPKQTLSPLPENQSETKTGIPPLTNIPAHQHHVNTNTIQQMELDNPAIDLLPALTIHTNHQLNYEPTQRANDQNQYSQDRTTDLINVPMLSDITQFIHNQSNTASQPLCAKSDKQVEESRKQRLVRGCGEPAKEVSKSDLEELSSGSNNGGSEIHYDGSASKKLG